jgi:hypothetical protein
MVNFESKLPDSFLKKGINMFLNSKTDYQSRLFDILTPVLGHYSVGKARLKLGDTGAGIAVGLLIAPNKLWEPLTPTAKEHLTSWLNEINTHLLVPSNCQFFGVLVNTALKKLKKAELIQNVLDQCFDKNTTISNAM